MTAQGQPLELAPENGAILSRRHMIMGAAMLATSGAALLRQPQEVTKRLAADAFEKMVPSVLGEWSFFTKSGLVLPPEDELSDSLYNQILTRVYTAPNRHTMMLLIAYSSRQDGMLQLHRPEVCYPASGMTLSDTKRANLNIGAGTSLPANHFSAKSEARTEQVFYWTRIGDQHPISWSDQRLAVVRANLKRVIPDGILVRISTFAPNYETAQNDIEDFARTLVSSATPQLSTLLIGNMS